MNTATESAKRLSLKLLIGISILTLALHLLFLFSVIPYEIAWGGNLKSDNEMYLFETISIAINSFFAYVLLQKARLVKSFFSDRALSVILWVFFGLFILNTVGNLFAKTTFEKSFSLLTLVNAILIWIINKKPTRLQTVEME